MTTIYLLTQGQQLINASKVVVASGDVKSVQLRVEFDSAEWKEYTNRSATFYTSNDPTVHEMLLLNNKCVVPFEVLQESGVLFIGVRGVSSDGERVKTSTIVKYKISKGAVAGDKTLTPTMNLYQQYLAALKNEAAPAIESIKAEVEKALETEIEALRSEAVATNEAARAMLESLQGTVLWENPDPTASFAATTIEMDLAEYKNLKVIYCYDTSKNTYEEQHVSVRGVTYALGELQTFLSDSGYSRNISITDTEIVVSDCTRKGSVANGMIIPVKIIGYKY